MNENKIMYETSKKENYHRFYLPFIFSPTALFTRLMRVGRYRQRESKTPTGDLRKKTPWESRLKTLPRNLFFNITTKGS